MTETADSARAKASSLAVVVLGSPKHIALNVTFRAALKIILHPVGNHNVFLQLCLEGQLRLEHLHYMSVNATLEILRYNNIINYTYSTIWIAHTHTHARMRALT